MFTFSSSIKCFVKIIVSSYYKKEINIFAESTSLLNICIVQILNLDEFCGQVGNKIKYAIYVPEEPHIKPLLNDELWVSSENLIKYSSVYDEDINITNTATDLLRIIIWYLSWNPIVEYSNSLSNFLKISPFPVCVISPNMQLGCILSYPYLLSKVPVTILLCNENEFNTIFSEIKEQFLSLVNIIKFSDTNSTITKLIDYTQNLGFSRVIIGPSTQLSENTLLYIALSCVSINGSIVFSSEIEQLSNNECSVLFQKRCTLSFNNQNPNPISWISTFVHNYLLNSKDSDMLDIVTSKVNSSSKNSIKIENHVAYVQFSNKN